MLSFVLPVAIEHNPSLSSRETSDKSFFWNIYMISYNLVVLLLPVAIEHNLVLSLRETSEKAFLGTFYD